VEAQALNAFWERVEPRDGDPVVRASGTTVAELVDRLEAGETLEHLARSYELAPIDVVSALAHDALGEVDTGGPPLVQSAPRRPWLARALSDASLAGLWPLASVSARLALAAGLLQIYDFWDASHNAAQQADDLGERSVSPYWHGIAHRREPDPGNASYWFRRVGRHPVFADLADAALPLIEANEPELAGTLLPRGAWDPFAFIDYCTGARTKSVPLALALQRLEMILLLGASLPS
jgi:hypothetical protein